jgi:hypothetical protein
MKTLKLRPEIENEWDIYDTIVMCQIPHTERWEFKNEKDGIIIVTLAEEDYKAWFEEENEEVGE